MLDPQTVSSDETAGHILLQTLSPGRTFLCTDVSSNIVVLKKLEDDCLYRGQLHPGIRERLARVRDVPHSRLATLRGVERWSEAEQKIPCLVWSWLDGETWDETLAKSAEGFGMLASAMVDAVNALHELGIVHGSLHGRNIIIRPDLQVWLTHVSPYLYNDPLGDVASIVALLESVALRFPEPTRDRLSIALNEVRAGQFDLRELSQSLRSLDEDQPLVASEAEKSDVQYKATSLIYAAVVTLLAVGLWFAIRRFCGAGPSVGPTTFPSLTPALKS